jgi:hypothetical protein
VKPKIGQGNIPRTGQFKIVPPRASLATYHRNPRKVKNYEVTYDQFVQSIKKKKYRQMITPPEQVNDLSAVEFQDERGPYQIHSGVILERLPEISRERQPGEQQFEEWKEERDFERAERTYPFDDQYSGNTSLLIGYFPNYLSF